jgi:hypothetical protein
MGRGVRAGPCSLRVNERGGEPDLIPRTLPAAGVSALAARLPSLVLPALVTAVAVMSRVCVGRVHATVTRGMLAVVTAMVLLMGGSLAVVMPATFVVVAVVGVLANVVRLALPVV